MRKLRLSVLGQLTKLAVSKLPPNISSLYINHKTLFLILFRSEVHQESLLGRFLLCRDWDINIYHTVNLDQFCLRFLKRKRELITPWRSDEPNEEKLYLMSIHVSLAS